MVGVTAGMSSMSCGWAQGTGQGHSRGLCPQWWGSWHFRQRNKARNPCSPNPIASKSLTHLTPGVRLASLGEMSVQVRCQIFKWIVCLMLSCMSSLYILDINPLSELLFANIFFHSIGCLFVLLVVSFAVQNSLIWVSNSFSSGATSASWLPSKGWM